MDGLYGQTAGFIGFFEGFEPTARWDVNAYRLGFGSDTEGSLQIRVTKGMTTTRARALLNLAARIPQYEHTIISQITQPAYAKLGLNTKIALLSFAYNYGSLTASVADAAKNNAHISEAIEARQSDNHAINARRRFAEAAMVASDGA